MQNGYVIHNCCKVFLVFQNEAGDMNDHDSATVHSYIRSAVTKHGRESVDIEIQRWRNRVELIWRSYFKTLLLLQKTSIPSYHLQPGSNEPSQLLAMIRTNDTSREVNSLEITSLSPISLLSLKFVPKSRMLRFWSEAVVRKQHLSIGKWWKPRESRHNRGESTIDIAVKSWTRLKTSFQWEILLPNLLTISF